MLCQNRKAPAIYGLFNEEQTVWPSRRCQQPVERTEAAATRLARGPMSRRMATACPTRCSANWKHLQVDSTPAWSGNARPSVHLQEKKTSTQHNHSVHHEGQDKTTTASTARERGGGGGGGCGNLSTHIRQEECAKKILSLLIYLFLRQLIVSFFSFSFFF